MNYSFISVVSLVIRDEVALKSYLKNVHAVLKENFSDYEIILINNDLHKDIRPITQEIEQDIKKDVTVINLSTEVPEDNALFAGLDRANGDYTVFLDMCYYKTPELVTQLYKKTQEQNIDIVYLKNKQRKLSVRDKFFFGLFYKFLHSVFDKNVNLKMEKSRIISRRALNSLLSLRESVRYFKGLFSFVGYDSTFIEIDIPRKAKKFKLKELFKFAFETFISFTNLLNKSILWIFILSLIFSLGITVDAVIAKTAGANLLKFLDECTTGMSFLIVMLSYMFTLISLMFYVVSLYLDHIIKEAKNRPVYIIESIQRL